MHVLCKQSRKRVCLLIAGACYPEAHVAGKCDLEEAAELSTISVDNSVNSIGVDCAIAHEYRLFNKSVTESSCCKNVFIINLLCFSICFLCDFFKRY